MPAELERLKRLPPKHPLVVEDVWLGSALWRYVGGQLPLQLYALNTLWDSVYMDTDGFRVGSEIAIFHNRRKYINRITVLYLYSEVEHCTLLPRWTQQRADCCGDSGKVWRRTGRFHGPNAWPHYIASVDRSACNGQWAHKSRRRLTDLRNVSNLRRLGVLERLPAEAQADVLSWMRRKG